MSSSYAKLKQQSPFLTHLNNYPLYVKAEKLAISFELINSIIEFTARHLLQLKVFVSDRFPNVLEFGKSVEKFIVDEVLIKYVDVYLFFIKENYHLSDISNNKTINAVKSVPGVLATEKLAIDTVGFTNRGLIIPAGKFVVTDLDKDYQQADSLSRELNTTLHLIDAIANAVKDIVVKGVKSAPLVNGRIGTKETAGQVPEASSNPAEINGTSDVAVPVETIIPANGEAIAAN